jgi:hypothetical protein
MSHEKENNKNTRENIIEVKNLVKKFGDITAVE